MYPVPLHQRQTNCTPLSTLPKCNSFCPLIITYHSGLDSLRHTLKESHHIFLSDLPFAIHSLTPSITLQHPPNFHQLLVRTNLDPWPPHPNTGSYPCQRPQCKTCPIHHSSLTFTNPLTNLTHPTLMPLAPPEAHQPPHLHKN